MPKCPNMTFLLSQSMDRDLSWRERAALELHLLQCQSCREAQRQLDFLRRAARRFRAELAAANGVKA
jgi:hypothetical protein